MNKQTQWSAFFASCIWLTTITIYILMIKLTRWYCLSDTVYKLIWNVNLFTTWSIEFAGNILSYWTHHMRMFPREPSNSSRKQKWDILEAYLLISCPWAHRKEMDFRDTISCFYGRVIGLSETNRLVSVAWCVWLVFWVLSSRSEEENICKLQGSYIIDHTYFKPPGRPACSQTGEMNPGYLHGRWET